MPQKLRGIVAAVFTPFDTAMNLNLDAVDRQAEHFYRVGVAGVFVGGTTGESHSLTVDERLALTKRWGDATRGSTLKVVAHVGSNCLHDAIALAKQAQELRLFAAAALAPSYFKPKNIEALVDWGAAIAAAAPELPFYHYDIPSMTGVGYPMPEYLALASKRIRNFAGVKFSNPDLMAFQRCIQFEYGRYDIPWGSDEALLAALSLGGVGGVGSSYNFATPIYHRLIEAFVAGDLATARVEQFRSVQVIDLLGRYGYLPAAKVVMGFLGVDVGAARMPLDYLHAERREKLRHDLDSLGFFGWLK